MTHPEQNFTEDQKREIALRMAVQASSGDADPKKVVDQAEAFFKFLTAGDNKESAHTWRPT